MTFKLPDTLSGEYSISELVYTDNDVDITIDLSKITPVLDDGIAWYSLSNDGLYFCQQSSIKDRVFSGNAYLSTGVYKSLSYIFKQIDGGEKVITISNANANVTKLG